jgi:predicted DNA-binding protein
MSKKNPSPAYSIRLTTEELAALREWAKREGKPMSVLIREGLAAIIGRETRAQVSVTAADETPIRLVLYGGDLFPPTGSRGGVAMVVEVAQGAASSS